MFSFADDTKLLSTTPAGNESSLPDDATTLFVRSEKNGLPFNIAKMQAVEISETKSTSYYIG